LVYSTKNRVPVLTDIIREPLHRYSVAVLENLSCRTTLVNSVEDHVHILFELSRTIPLSKAVEDVKKASSKWLKTQGDQYAEFSWQAGYGAFAVSISDIALVREYIARQAEHHHRKTFQEEFLSLLEQHNLAYDERYLWD
jgi:REP element-mobilizing transposase RayT